MLPPRSLALLPRYGTTCWRHVLHHLLSGIGIVRSAGGVELETIEFIDRQPVARLLIEPRPDLTRVVHLDHTILDIDVHLTANEILRQWTVRHTGHFDHAVGLDRARLASLPAEIGHPRAGRARRLPEEVVSRLQQRLGALDVNAPARQPVGKPRVLALLADGKGHLVARHDHGRDTLVVDLVERDVRRLGRAQRIRDKRRDVRRPFDHVDLLAVQLVHDVLDADTPDTDARANRVDLLLARRNGDLGAKARLTGDLHDLDRAALDLRHFLLEEPADQSRIGPRHDQLRTARVRVHFGQQDLQALVRAIPLGRDLLARRHHSFGLAELDDHRAIVGPLDDTAEDFAFLILVLLVDSLALEVADAGVDHLLDCLGGDATEVLRRPHDLDRITDDRRRRVLLRLFDRDLQVGVLDNLGDRLDDDDLHLAGRLVQ